MKFTEEQLKAAKAAKSAEELISIAAKEGVTLDAANANTYFAKLHGEGKLSDEELANAAGGDLCGDTYQKPSCYTEMKCANCGYSSTWGGDYLNGIAYECPTCHVKSLVGCYHVQR